MAQTKHSALLSALGTLAPAHVVRPSLAIAARIVAHKAFLLFAFGTDHVLGGVSRESDFLALLTHICHTVGTVGSTHAAAFGMVALRTLLVPENTPLFAIGTVLVRSPPTTNGLGLLAKGAAAFESSGTLAPTVLHDSVVSVLANWVAQVIRLFVPFTTLTDHLTHISKPCSQPA